MLWDKYPSRAPPGLGGRRRLLIVKSTKWTDHPQKGSLQQKRKSSKCSRRDVFSPFAGKPGEFFISVSEGKIIPPINSTCPVRVAWPKLEYDAYTHCKAEGMAMLVELMDQNGHLTDDGLLSLIGGIYNLRQPPSRQRPALTS